jgi:hypothetical protein
LRESQNKGEGCSVEEGSKEDRDGGVGKVVVPQMLQSQTKHQ